MKWFARKRNVRSLLTGCLFSLLCLLAITSQARDLNTITVGIISPRDGSNQTLTGESHEESIRLAFNHLGPLQVGDLQIKLALSPWNDQGKPDVAASGAVQLARDEHVVALLGPVNSGSTKETLKVLRTEQIEIPVISALSTAPELTYSGARDKNFFRLIFDDADRMGQYATFIKQEKGKQGDQHFLFLYEDSPYGEGLMLSLKDRFYTPNVVARSWTSIVHEPCSKNGFPAATPQEAMRSGQCFSEDFRKLIEPSDFDNIVLLGNTSGSLALVDGLNAANLANNVDYFFVGSDKRLFDEAPTGSMTIGDPVLDFQRAPTPELGNDWRKLLQEFEERAKKDHEDFVMTAYEAAMVLHSALRIVLSNERTLPEIHELRRKLLHTLESETFDSLEPWRTISFSHGKLDQIPTAPIYRITRGVNREDAINPHPWVGLAVKPYSAWLEAPVEVDFSAHGTDRARLTVYRVDETTLHEQLIEERTLQFLSGQTREQFHLLERGLYRFRMLDVPFYPVLTETRVDLSHHYLISAIAALVGAILAVSHASFTILSRFMRILTGMASGLLLTFASFYGQQLSSWMPFPSFGSEPVINAMLTGLIGGLIGPQMLTDLLLTWSKRLLIPGKPG